MKGNDKEGIERLLLTRRQTPIMRDIGPIQTTVVSPEAK